MNPPYDSRTSARSHLQHQPPIHSQPFCRYPLCSEGDTLLERRRRRGNEAVNDKGDISHWLEMLEDPSEKIRSCAVDGLRHGLATSEVIPLLVRALQEDDSWLVRASASHALTDIVQDEYKQLLLPFLESIIDGARDRSPHVSCNNICTLGELGPKARAALPLL